MNLTTRKRRKMSVEVIQEIIEKVVKEKLKKAFDKVLQVFKERNWTTIPIKELVILFNELTR